MSTTQDVTLYETVCICLEHPPLVLRSDCCFFQHSPILSRLSTLRRYQSLVKVEEIAPTWCVTKDPSLFSLSLACPSSLKRFCFSHQAKWHVRVSKQSCKQANRLILWGVGGAPQKKNRFFLFFFPQKNLKKYDLTRPKVSKHSLTS
jgi:hypothetical protein